ncbi:hypothetical protein ACIGXM_13740 [Kitasatospora sp. NPDC052896]|uniref:hypothetical protein n=1 Tax=Kitasatospora sp. NPDC052896 TaxID=3364061 RepID=UPI0037C6181B
MSAGVPARSSSASAMLAAVDDLLRHEQRLPDATLGPAEQAANWPACWGCR